MGTITVSNSPAPVASNRANKRGKPCRPHRLENPASPPTHKKSLIASIFIRFIGPVPSYPKYCLALRCAWMHTAVAQPRRPARSSPAGRQGDLVGPGTQDHGTHGFATQELGTQWIALIFAAEPASLAA